MSQNRRVRHESSAPVRVQSGQDYFAEPAMTARPKRRWYQFSLGLLLSLVTAACLLLWWDPLGWRPPAPVPILTFPRGATAQVDLIEVNEQYDALRRMVFKQVIFWSRYPDGQLHIRE